jgi:hypothetical protein
MNRGIRRQQKKRAFEKAKRIAEALRLDKGFNEAEINHWAHRMEKNRKDCSCQMCRNPRHSAYTKGTHKLTMQERKAELP